MRSLVPLLLFHGASSLDDAAIHSSHNSKSKRNPMTSRKRKSPSASSSSSALHSSSQRSAPSLRGSPRSLESPNGNTNDVADPLISWSATEYLASHPFYPSHDDSDCLDARAVPPPEWMAMQGGYAENHLFAGREECCERWGFRCGENDVHAGEKHGHDDAAVISTAGSSPDSDRTLTTPTTTHHLTTAAASEQSQFQIEIIEPENEHLGAYQVAQTTDAALDDDDDDVPSASSSDTFPTSSCGATFSDASRCNQLCLSGSACPAGQSCYSNIPCPSSLVAAAMGDTGQDILDLIGAGTGDSSSDEIERNVCGSSYDDAESSCSSGYTDSFVSCDDDGATCPPDRICYSGIRCPAPPTISPMPTRSPVPRYDVGRHDYSIVGYYAAWQWYDRQKVAVPKNIKWEMITRVAYAFFMLDESGDIWGTDSWADPRILYGDVLQTPPAGEICSPQNSTAAGCFCHWSAKNAKECAFHDHKTSGLIYLAHANAVQVYPSIGGWTLSDPYPAVAADDTARKNFAAKCVELIRDYQFDGIDIDWEYPGYEDHSGTPADIRNFILLLKEIRSALDDHGAETGKRYGLTAALPCGPANIANADVTAISEILDELNLMTYDFHGAWDAKTGVNAPLFDQAEGDPEKGWSVHGCVENWVGSRSGNPKGEEQRKKVNIGLPFYGRSYLNANALYAPHGGIDEVNWKEDDGSPQYFNLMARMGEMTSVRDDVTKTQYAYFNNGDGFVSYDDERAICDKADYAINNGLGGFIIWELSGDLMDDLYTPLLEAVNRKIVVKDLDCEKAYGGRQEAMSDASSSELIHKPLVANTAAVLEDAPEAEATTTFAEEQPIVKKDKTEIVGIPVIEKPVPAPAPAPKPLPSPSSNESPYTLDKSTLGTTAVAATSCTGGCPSGSTCVGNQAGGQLIKDEECSPCNSGQTWWPCDVQGLCWCWLDGTDRIAPAPESGVEIQVEDPYYTVCDDILTREIFDIIAPEHKEPYSYTGLCDAILSYNAHHTEKAFGMGDVFQRAAELAAFLGNTLHESDEFRAGREYLMCADHKTVGDEVYCKPCDSGSFDWATFTCPQSLITGAADFNEYCQPDSVPPEACNCGNGKGQTGELEGYVPANDLFFGRGAIQLSWNYNYIGASIALTGSPDTFCNNPDLVATEGKYAWGAGLFFWMEHSKEGSTCHTESLKNMDFGGTLNNINGGLECPAHGGWHEEAVKSRLNRYCRASKALGLPNLMTLSGCAGLDDKMADCLAGGTCTDCQDFVGTNAGDHPTNFVPPVSASSPAESIQVEQPDEPEPQESLCDDGLMALPGHPKCCVPNTAFIGDGACDPDTPYNTEACGWDGGDCCKQTCNPDSAFGCKTKESGEFGEYGPFGFYCLDPSQADDVIDSLQCNDVDRERIGDGKCNPTLNVAGCNFDGGDCCEETCDDEFAFYPCGSGLQSYVCMDPRFKIDTPAPSSRPTPKPIQPLTDRPTYRSTKKPTELPSSAPTYKLSSKPSRAPTKDTSSESFLSDSSTHFVESNTIDSPCPSDFKECKNTGIFVGRDPEKNCRFRPCDTAEPGTAPVGIEQPEVSCPSDFKECRNSGALVGRNPLNGCRFNPCPDKEDDPPEKDTSTIQNDASSQPPEKPCPSDFKECKGTGIFVSRDPSNNCRFKSCPEKEEETPSNNSDPTNKHDFSSMINASSHPSEVPCPSDFKECKGNGIFVSRDPSSNCRFKPCPEKEDETSSNNFDSADKHEFSSMIQSAMQGKSNNNPQLHVQSTEATTPASIESSEMPACPQDVRECLDGTFVGRDPADGCRYLPCTNTVAAQTSYHQEEDPSSGGHHKNSMANSISQALGGLHHKSSDAPDRGDTETDAKSKPSGSMAEASSAASLVGTDSKTDSETDPPDRMANASSSASLLDIKSETNDRSKPSESMAEASPAASLVDIDSKADSETDLSDSMANSNSAASLVDLFQYTPKEVAREKNIHQKGND